MWFTIMQGGTRTTVLTFDESDDRWEIPTGKGLAFGTNQWDNGSDKIDGAMIEDDGIDSAQYAAASIDNEHLADDAVGVDELATDSVTMDAVDADGAFTSLTGAWATTGLLSGGVITNSKSANYIIGTDNAAECYGGIIYVTSTCDITACDNLAAGMNFTVITIGATQVDVDVQADDLMNLDGTPLNDGDKAVNTSTAGDIISCYYYDATGWYCISGGTDGDRWTDGG
jgi:hypothetical protein